MVIGGGLAGLVSSILLNRAGNEVVVFEKKQYPFHRVCGEYISNETVPFLKREGLFPTELQPSDIRRFCLTSVNGKAANMKLDLGGFGISRYALDQFLYQKGLQEGVTFYLDTEVESVAFEGDQFELHTLNNTFFAPIVIGGHGKRSRLDHHLHRSFITQRSPYVGVKYHIRAEHPADLIALHNFKDGYCGMSHIEDGKINLCYLTHRNNLKVHKSIAEMEKAVLFRNPFLKDVFQNAEFLFDKPEVINEISFETKQPVEQHVLMAGDAAGMITPLCGNGMAMAIHSAFLLSGWVDAFAKGKINRAEMEKRYEAEWKRHFATRLWAGRQIQRLFGSEGMSNLAVNLVNHVTPLANFLMRNTHGQPF